jgi:predicted transposase YbfD/YdcC
VLGQVKVAEKSNEIIAIPALLDMLAIAGAIVTIDAMACSPRKFSTTRPITSSPSRKANGFKDTKVSRHQTVDGDHGRIETRTYTAIRAVAAPAKLFPIAPALFSEAIFCCRAW